MIKLTVTIIGLLIVALSPTNALSQSSDGLWAKIDVFSQAVADDDVLRAAELANLDFTKEGLHITSPESYGPVLQKPCSRAGNMNMPVLYLTQLQRGTRPFSK